MIILVGVTITVALNGGLFSTAKQATQGTETEKNKELALSKEEVQIDGLIYASMDDYLNENPKLADGWTVSTDEERANAWPTETVKNENVTAIKETTTNKIVPLPKGFQVSLEEGENTVSGGLVITDGTNEFVWIPVTSTYTEDNLGPLKGTDSTSTFAYNSQKELNYYYGTNEDGTPYYDYADFNYTEDKSNIETSINKYKGFYIGRYETTIDENGKIGSMKNKPVLTASKSIPETNNKECRWWGLYKVQKDMYADNEAVFSTMITSKEWNATMSLRGNPTRATNTYTKKPDLSGSAYIGTTDTYDVSKNIYDLAGNVHEWTLTADSTSYRVGRGGNCISGSGSARITSIDYPYGYSYRVGSRLALYIK